MGALAIIFAMRRTTISMIVNGSNHAFDQVRSPLNPEGIGGGGQSDLPPSIFLASNFCFLTDYQKLWHNCSLFVTSFDSN